MNKLNKFGVCVFLSGLFAGDFITSLGYKTNPDGFSRFLNEYAWVGISADMLAVVGILLLTPKRNDIKNEIIQESNND